MTHLEKCKACEDSFRDHGVEALKKTCGEARQAYEEANIAYLTARDSYHKVYREIWFSEVYGSK